MRLFLMTVPTPLEKAVRACRQHFVMAACFSALVNVLYLTPTIYMMQVYDRVVPTGGILTLLWITVILGVALATLAALDAVRSRVMMRASLRLNRLLAGEILDRLMSRSKLKAGDPSTNQAMREFDTMRQALGGQATIALFDTPWTPIYFLVAFLIHPILGGMIVLGAAILTALAIMNERSTKPLSERAHLATSSAYACQEAAIGNSEVIRALGMRRSLVARQLQERQSGLEASAAVQFAGTRYSSIIKFVRMFMQSLALGAGGWLAIEGQISVGAIIAASVLLNRALQPIEQLVGLWPTIVQARQAMRSIAFLFESTDREDEGMTTLPEPDGHLELDHVVVRNPEGNAVLLRNVCATLVPGQILGVIGPSGAGKTTLARVAAGATAPDLGEVRIDGANVDDWDAELLGQHIGYLPQDSALLPGTIGENISRFAAIRGVPKAVADEEVVRAARKAGVHDLILRLPGGYDTVVGGRNHRLSAGQAQRIALARALYGNPKVLILDEPNSALDAEGEDALMRAVARARIEGAAIMIVAHRASILADAERLLVLQDGMVAGIGPREEIMDEIRRRAERETVVPMKERAQS
ncbi:type I secretion system permease/ATPase [Sphingosinicella sp. CPCC 101087]|uniref:type I secretion system permease/ATPase n=1 Tax=Sphingosinicella sp. CPCC 101087 TaxID=2497754 RepID=UPI00101D5087|nr:type I secretion system permease/ATPase [Sphingosinicella sp. CPCC 101087]